MTIVFKIMDGYNEKQDTFFSEKDAQKALDKLKIDFVEIAETFWIEEEEVDLQDYDSGYEEQKLNNDNLNY